MSEKKQQLNVNDIDFESAMARIEKIVAALEDQGSSLKLDASLELYEEGIALVRACQIKLDNAQRRISCLAPDENGEIVESDFASEE